MTTADSPQKIDVTRTRSVVRRFTDALIFGLAAYLIWVGAGYVSGSASAIAPAATPQLLQPGGTLDLAAIDWDKADWHLVLALSPTCPTCIEHADSYKEIATIASSQHLVRFTVLAAEPHSQVRDWLQTIEAVPDDQIQFVDLVSLGFYAVPTLLAVNDTGRVVGLLAGPVSREQEVLFLSWVEEPSSSPFSNVVVAPEIGESDFLQLARPGLVLDVRDRAAFGSDHRPGAINIPADELEIRAPIELHATTGLIVDCSRLDLRRCREAGLVLTQIGLTRTSLLVPTP